MTENRFRRTLLTLAAAMASVLVMAQSPGPETATAPPGHPLSLQECIRTAVAHNPNAAVLLHAGRAAMARVGTARSAYWPTLGLAGDLSRSYAEPSSGGASRYADSSGVSSTSTSTSAQLSGQYTLWDSGQRQASESSAKAGYAASDATFKATVQDLALSVESAYYGLEGAQWGLQVAKDTAKQTAFHLEVAQAQFDHGLVPRSDVLQAATANANSALAAIQAQSAVISNRSSLAVLMGWPADSAFEIEAPDYEAALPALPDWESGRTRALASLPEIKAAFETSEALRFSLREVQTSYRPTITADGSYGRVDAGRWPNRETWSAGLTLRIPIFTGFARTWQVIQAKEAWEGSKMSLESVKLASEKAAFEARTQLETALQSVDAAKALVESAQENADVAEGQYKEGLGSMTNVVDATTALQNAKLQLISARLSVLTAKAAWNRSTGVDLLAGAEVPSTQASADEARDPMTPSPKGEPKP